jgi:hypothetical protein
MNEYEVIIIGGGATGAGVLRDCCLRGLKGYPCRTFRYCYWSNRKESWITS